MPGPSSGCFVMTKSVHQHKIVKAGKLQKSESSLICVVIAEGSTNADRSQKAPENKGKMDKTGCEIICGAPTTLAVKG